MTGQITMTTGVCCDEFVVTLGTFLVAPLFVHGGGCTEISINPFVGTGVHFVFKGRILCYRTETSQNIHTSIARETKIKPPTNATKAI